MKQHLLIGRELQNGKYRVTSSIIGRGGMADVYEGFDTKLKRKVAIKVLRQEYINNPYLVRRFYEEAQIAASCDHPNIVKIYDIEAEGDTHFFAMQFLFKSLKDILKEKKTLLALEAVKILKPIAEALSYVHNKNIVHKDIKPGNIMFDEHNNSILTDFGIALSDDTTRFQGSVENGTPQYMSPEQSKGKKIDFRSDIYSLGIVLYELVTGNVPYQAEDPQSILYKHVHEPLPEKPLQDNQVPKRVKDILYKCLAKSPDERFQSTQALVEAFDDIIWNPPTIRIRKKPKRLKAKLLIPLLVSILLFIVVGLWFIHKIYPSIRFPFPLPFLSTPNSPSSFATISLSLQLDSIKDTTIPFPAQICFRGEGEETTLIIHRTNAVIKFYPDSVKRNLESDNLATNSAGKEFAIYSPVKDTFFVLTISANVPYYRPNLIEETLWRDGDFEIGIRLTSKDRFCGQCGKEFSFGETICMGMLASGDSCRCKRTR